MEIQCRQNTLQSKSNDSIVPSLVQEFERLIKASRKPMTGKVYRIPTVKVKHWIVYFDVLREVWRMINGLNASAKKDPPIQIKWFDCTFKSLSSSRSLNAWLKQAENQWQIHLRSFESEKGWGARFNCTEKRMINKRCKNTLQSKSNDSSILYLKSHLSRSLNAWLKQAENQWQDFVFLKSLKAPEKRMINGDAKKWPSNPNQMIRIREANCTVTCPGVWTPD